MCVGLIYDQHSIFIGLGKWKLVTAHGEGEERAYSKDMGWNPQQWRRVVGAEEAYAPRRKGVR